MTVLTPTVRQGARKSLFWVGALVFVILVAIGGALMVGAANDTTPLSPINPAPDGTMAVAEVLRQQGVDVIPTSTLGDTARAVDGEDNTTIVVNDADEFLDDEQRETLLGLAGQLIVIDPSFSMLAVLAPGVSAAGAPDDDPLVADCSLPVVANADEVSPGGSSYRIASGVDAETCLRSDSAGADEAFSLVQVEVDGTTVTIVGATDALTNGAVAQRANAAFALTLLGGRETLVWYQPTIVDFAGSIDPATLNPPWVTPVIVLLAITALAAAVWRGRRFGPLIIENLPVVVRASETMEGRARLYQRGSARLHALDALRIGTISRLATRCGLASSATVDEVVLAIAAVAGADPRDIRTLLVDDVPTSDVELVRLSDRLLDLETSVANAMRP